MVSRLYKGRDLQIESCWLKVCCFLGFKEAIVTDRISYRVNMRGDDNRYYDNVTVTKFSEPTASLKIGDDRLHVVGYKDFNAYNTNNTIYVNKSPTDTNTAQSIGFVLSDQTLTWKQKQSGTWQQVFYSTATR